MIWQTALSADSAEVVYRGVVSGITATNTDASLQEGEPVILDTAGSPLGQAVIRALTVTNVAVNRLCVGAVKGTIAHEAVGLVQVYGVGSVRLKEAATIAAGEKLVPDLNTTATALTASGRGAWIARTITDTDIHYSPGHSVIVVAPATAVSGTAGVTNGSAFIRAL
jgi:hypothetical protein